MEYKSELEKFETDSNTKKSIDIKNKEELLNYKFICILIVLLSVVITILIKYKKNLKKNIKIEWDKYISNYNFIDIDSINFDIFKFSNIINKNYIKYILPIISFEIFRRKNFFNVIDENSFKNLIVEIAQEYNSENYYHNDIHAADVLQTIYSWDNIINFEKTLRLRKEDIIILYLSAIIHDIGHPGFNNQFVSIERNIDKNYYKFRGYPIDGLLEYYHAEKGIDLINKYKLLNNFYENKYETFVNNTDYTIKEYILGTNMGINSARHKEHIKFLKQFKMYIDQNKLLNYTNINKSLNIKDRNDAEIHNYHKKLLNSILHCADISGQTKNIKISNNWALRINKEFFRQGDLEKLEGRNVSLGCDKNKDDIYKGQLGYISFILKDLFLELVNIFPELKFMLNNIEDNYKYYKERSS